MDENTIKFINFVKKECIKHNVTIKEYKRGYIKLSDGIKCSGYFEENFETNKKPILAFAKGHPDWLSILVHEYCHMTQYLDDIDLWKTARLSLDIVDEWLQGSDLHNSTIDTHLDVLKELELDNEKRSVEIIKQWNLPIDIDMYIKKANAYVLFYNYIKITRKWSKPENSPYLNLNIVNSMSNKFDMDYIRLSDKLINLYKQENI